MLEFRGVKISVSNIGQGINLSEKYSTGQAKA